jgi:Holliday junction resolvase
LKPETKFYAEIKKYFNKFSLIRLENLSLAGTPDLLVYNNSRHFFTIELKVTRSKKISFSPHQIAFHVRHPENTFILVKSLASREVKLYEGKDILLLAARGLSLEPCCSGLDACRLKLESLGA